MLLFLYWYLFISVTKPYVIFLLFNNVKINPEGQKQLCGLSLLFLSFLTCVYGCTMTLETMKPRKKRADKRQYPQLVKLFQIYKKSPNQAFFLHIGELDFGVMTVPEVEKLMSVQALPV